MGLPGKGRGVGGGRPVPRGAPGWKRALGGALHTDRLAPEAMGGSPECSAAGHRWVLKLGCMSALPGDLQNILTPKSHPRLTKREPRE